MDISIVQRNKTHKPAKTSTVRITIEA